MESMTLGAKKKNHRPTSLDFRFLASFAFTSPMPRLHLPLFYHTLHHHLRLHTAPLPYLLTPRCTHLLLHADKRLLRHCLRALAPREPAARVAARQRALHQRGRNISRAAGAGVASHFLLRRLCTSVSPRMVPRALARADAAFSFAATANTVPCTPFLHAAYLLRAATTTYALRIFCRTASGARCLTLYAPAARLFLLLRLSHWRSRTLRGSARIWRGRRHAHFPTPRLSWRAASLTYLHCCTTPS